MANCATTMGSMSMLERQVTELVKPRGILGFKMFSSKATLKEMGIVSLEQNMALCQVFKVASLFEKTRGLFFENVDKCVMGTHVLGFGELPEDIVSRLVQAENYNRSLFSYPQYQSSSAEFIKHHIQNVESLPLRKYEAAVMGPLREFDNMKLEPDGVLIFANSCQIYLLARYFFDATGKKVTSTVNGHASCEIMGAVAKGNSPWLTLPCGGARGMGESQDDEIWFGIKPAELRCALDRMIERGGKYPPKIYPMVANEPPKANPMARTLPK